MTDHTDNDVTRLASGNSRERCLTCDAFTAVEVDRAEWLAAAPVEQRRLGRLCWSKFSSDSKCTNPPVDWRTLYFEALADLRHLAETLDGLSRIAASRGVR
jgi:hypothetical protein